MKKNNFIQETSTETCCCSSNGGHSLPEQETSTEICCCSSSGGHSLPEQETSTETCCCSSSGRHSLPEQETSTETCCCSSSGGHSPSEQETNTETCCCSSNGGHSLPEQETNTETCCCSSNGGHSLIENKQKTQSCCGTQEEKQSFCGCCGGNDTKKRQGWRKYQNLIFLIISLLSIIASFVMSEIDSLHDTVWHYIDFGFIAVVLCGFPIMKNAVKNIRRGKSFREKITSPLLISISMIACITLQILIWSGALEADSHGHSYIFAAGEVAWLMALGSMIEDFTVRKARSGIERLINMSPVTAKIRINGELIERPLSEINVGDIVTVLPNDMISVDGEIISGQTSVDEAVMTGESIPVDKMHGDKVFGGTWNKSGAIEIRVSKARDDMTITKLRKLVEEAEGKKAPISKLADKFASLIIPTAVFLAILIFIVNYFAMKLSLIQSIVNGVTMLVVFCPCALALATPTAVAAGLGNATKRGILIKSGGALEALATTKTIAFDKTGTLTCGKIGVDKVIAYEIAEKELLYYAGSAENLSEHPIAKAISSYAAEKTNLSTPQNTKSMIGIGVEADIDGQKVIICKWDNLKEMNVEYSFATKDAEILLNEGKTLAAITISGKLSGLISLADSPREGAKSCVHELKLMNINTVMLTGDNVYVAKNISEKLGLDTAYSSLMPEDKLKKIEELKTQGTVCMIGDGVNDAPALAAADCSMAIGGLGSDVAIETADATLMSGDIRKIPGLLRLSKSMMGKIKLNITISMTISLAAFVLSLFSILNPVTGALVHNISSVMVVSNSALLLRKKEHKK